MKLIAAMLLFAIFHAPGTQADSLGRLFFTPEQRARLEHRHAAEASDTPSRLTVNGVVQRHGGARTVWINGAAQDSAHDSEPAAEAVPVPGKSGNVKIKVGQNLLLAPAASPIRAASAE